MARPDLNPIVLDGAVSTLGSDKRKLGSDQLGSEHMSDIAGVKFINDSNRNSEADRT
jgi:hypothetical protein